MSLYGHQLQFTPLPGERGVSEMLAVMAAFVQESHRRGLVERVAAGIAASVPRGDRRAQAKAVYDWIREHVVFKPDPAFTDQVRDPDQLITEILQRGRTSGDCDDVATLGAALLRHLGFVPVFLVLGKPGDYYAGTKRVRLSHVIYGARLGERVVPFDPQEGVPPGELPPREHIGRLEVYEIFRTG